MAGLQVRIKHGEKMIVNGAAIQFLSDANIRFTNKVRFIYGRQLMSPEEATNTARRIYFNVQVAYIGEPDERAPAMAEARILIDLFRAATTSTMARHLLDRILAAVKDDRFDHALRAAMRLVSHEDELTETLSPATASVEIPRTALTVQS